MKRALFYLSHALKAIKFLFRVFFVGVAGYIISVLNLPSQWHVYNIRWDRMYPWAGDRSTWLTQHHDEMVAGGAWDYSFIASIFFLGSCDLGRVDVA